MLVAALLSVLPLFVAPRTAGAVTRPTLYYGFQGPSVRLVQWKLQQWGYYGGAVDGIFGDATLAALKLFQRRNGLRVDGVVGEEVWGAIGLPSVQEAPAPANAGAPQGGGKGAGWRSDELYLLAHVIQGEAEAEPYKGKVAVAAVILNRIRSPLFPHSVAEVIYQPLAFESVDTGTFYDTPSDEAWRAAQDALNGWDPTDGSIFFWNPAKVAAGNFVWNRPIVTEIGGHVFAR